MTIENNMTKTLDTFHVYELLHTEIAGYTWFAHAHATFTTIANMLGYKAILYKFAKDWNSYRGYSLTEICPMCLEIKQYNSKLSHGSRRNHSGKKIELNNYTYVQDKIKFVECN